MPPTSWTQRDHTYSEEILEQMGEEDGEEGEEIDEESGDEED